MDQLYLLFRPEFLERLGTFYGTFSSVEMTIDWAIGKFLKTSPEDTHLITSSMEFGRKAALLGRLVARSDHKNKDIILRSLKSIQNESKRNTFAHSYLQTTTDTVSFLERTPAGSFNPTLHTFTLPRFQDHLFRFTEGGKDLSEGLEVTQSDLDAFCLAAMKMSKSAPTSPKPPRDTA